MKGWLLLVLLCAGLAQAQTYRWVDKDGKVHYGDRPPPAATAKVQELKMGAPTADKTLPYAVRQAMGIYPVTLYVSAECADACRESRDYLKRRGIPFSEKNVATSEEIDALRQLQGGGDVAVPVLQVGGKTLKGFQDADWGRLLDAAGYPKAAGR
ncbi:MAG: DUF4124 domain-containing protein [Rhodocyclaceae bacterium]